MLQFAYKRHAHVGKVGFCVVSRSGHDVKGERLSIVRVVEPVRAEGGCFMADVTYPCYWQRKDGKGHWYWIYYAKNGEAIARSSESYVNRSDCTHSITLVQNSKNDKIFYTE